ncbi:hypothetical protein QUF90_01165 [Desulfococcaceae bacterium HSG9]|nr:hypothetical protein [Desulfococcaceae bacterium HSG9]
MSCPADIKCRVGNVSTLTRFVDDDQAEQRTLLKETAVAHRFLVNGGQRRQRLVQIPDFVPGVTHPTKI